MSTKVDARVVVVLVVVRNCERSLATYKRQVKHFFSNGTFGPKVRLKSSAGLR